jgi:hypothetical protein
VKAKHPGDVDGELLAEVTRLNVSESDAYILDLYERWIDLPPLRRIKYTRDCGQ